MDSRQHALVDLGKSLMAAGYRFITTAPLTHEIVNRRPGNERARSVADVFGWSRPFAPGVLPADMLALLEAADAVVPDGDLLRSTVRFSSLGNLLIVHSAFPTRDENSVFFGPDTYRTCRAMHAQFAADPGFLPETIIDIGAGAGAVGLYAASILPSRPTVILADINDAALRLCAVNAGINGISGIEPRHSDILESVPETADLIVSNPPFMVDRLARTYRDGGGEWGVALSCRIAAQAQDKLGRHGRLMLFTGTPVVAGEDMFARALEGVIDRSKWLVSYAEVASDIYPEELLQAAYQRADRIAAVFLVAGRGQFPLSQ